MAGTPTEITFEAPGPGQWELDATHRGRRPVTPFVRDALAREVEAGSEVLVARYGLPLEGIRAGFVHGCLYLRPTGLGEGPTPKAPPPVWVMKIGVRVHPGMRRRNRAAAQAWRDRAWRQDVDQWFEHDRDEIVAKNLAFQRVELAPLDDDALAAHALELLQHFATQAGKNFEYHGGDLIPAGDFLVHCRQWGIADTDATELLRGSSPATVETAALLAPLARMIADSGQKPSSLAEVRARAGRGHRRRRLVRAARLASGHE